ncbi:MAG TPA: glucuronate isomerase [Phycisphaerae bacterium]|nr:glucuronate isomerase [Phycisphaerae bacterium]
MPALNDLAALDSAVRRAVAETTITDIHTHLFPPSHGEMLLWGVDELLTYHYLVAELFTVAPRELTPAKFWQLGKAEQADLVWEHVFLRHGALSEAARGAVTALNTLGLDVAGRDLGGIRKWFAEQNVEDYLARVFETAGLDYAVMTNDPFKAEEVEHWDANRPLGDLLKPALRIDSLLVNWPAAAVVMKAAGYETAPQLQADSFDEARSFKEARRFLADWAKRMKPVYLAMSLPPDFHYPCDEQLYGRAYRNVVLPAAKELGLPIAMMIGVRKQVNPALRDGGDAVGVADVTAVQELCAGNGDVKFLVTMLSRVNQHELCVCARKFGNLHLFGCWWFCNDPSIIDEMTRMRLELLGATFTANHSDARVLDQLLYKWPHTRAVVADAVADKYRLLFEAGWRPTEDEVKRDVRNLFGGAFEEFLRK